MIHTIREHFSHEKELSPKERKLLEAFPYFDPTHIGDLVSRGGQHTVVRYGSDMVLKLPNGLPFAIKTPQAAQRNVALLQQYFPDYMMPTEVYQVDSTYCLVQEYLRVYEPLTSRVLPEVKDQFHDMLDSNGQLITDTGFSLEPVGGEGFWRTAVSRLRGDHPTDLVLANIVVDRRTPGEPHLLIPDIGLYTLEAHDGRNYQALSLLLFGLSQVLIRHYLDMDLRGEHLQASNHTAVE
ncbi:hypothetical protein A3H80_01180 [Candidatus Roizmanbacteria bacterium RIFCSPLOWO2_02_FULL_37_19]|uniref:Aminoglycoside phosphotransferase domain-containing protein n=1 Tax=Candidatus Roizmanbacteria bacterium RIFCSPHIGHO2_02_FULL_37_24 TaxID=1802037 RepID=A0A1F7GU24_9BACT|nr:MAG: hypothetical protein A2862_00615 [Candidatus Roizmanbacteria bacterium RIFCSPHIGHO2_01_FULL_38_41]OGK22550.1 MAG: hypothetical protein A3C24_05300 [Candidatus Roizmanbacteria bacterium RIFCSPHIGHO2_02_FULL_37_24]OGK33950.1 MAG: hypothetical protein A3E10_02085 [Candidatus Roizmanbacteria bacterium RIFCSPHIGHO2_12_FULL_37_23]OGK43632.1 MAG: hypothetical protein A2956_03980 [Candidatus Roizmanbacteria bacterium RIFCSPLOWO2_01_FULL_37_57]OGK54213.1 MAG: hypothetical protein A3H80_01180 [Ca